MSVVEQPKETSSDAVKQTIAWARKQGFRPVPLRYASKAAFNEKYVDLNYVPPEDDLWTGRKLGVGVVCGPKYGPGPVDVDLDCDEAVAFAKIFLPTTSAVFGRASKRSSHWLYRVEVDEFPKRAYGDPVQGSTIVELRGDGGHQTVFPGSIHETTHEEIKWEINAFPDVPKVDAAALELAVKKIAIATLIVRHAWLDGQRNEVCKHLAGIFFYLDWTEDEVKQLIEAVMEYTGDNDKTRIKTVHTTYKKGEKGGKITGSNSLRALLGDAKVVDRLLEWSGSTAASLLQDYNERFAVVTVKGKFRIAETAGVSKGDPPTLFARDDFLNLMETDTFTADDGKKVPKARVWLASPRRRAYRGMDYIPGVEDASPILNLWTGWGVDPKPDASCSAWKDLIYYTICGSDDETYKWLINWFANILIEPKNKPLTAPVLVGRQGAGKSLSLGYFGRILGPAYTTVTHDEHIYGKFNKHLATTLLLHSEEALYGGDRKHRGIIKSLITDEWRIFEQKGVDAERVHNYLRLVLTSNESWAAPTEVDDRRFTIIDLEGRSAPAEIIKAVLHEQATDGPAGLFHYLTKELEYDPALPRKNLKNEALASLKKINMDPVATWWYECLKLGQLLPDYLSWACKPEGEAWPEVVASTALLTAMQLHTRLGKARYVPDATTFALTLNRMVNTKLEREQRYFNNPVSPNHPREVRMLNRKQHTILNMPTLENCRRAFGWYIGQEISWSANEKEVKEQHDKF
jgi:hypothetical protein